jgi:hypothetical protein
MTITNPHLFWQSGEVSYTILMGFPLGGTTQIPSTPLLIEDCGLMIAE